MSRGFGPMFDEPAALGLRQRCSAQSIFPGQTTAIELGSEIRQRADFALVAGALGKVAGQAHDEPEAVLKIADFGFRHHPTPVERPVLQHKPRQYLDEPRLEVFVSERDEQDVTGVFRDPVPRAQVGQPGVSQAREVPRQRGHIGRGGQRSPSTRRSRRALASFVN